MLALTVAPVYVLTVLGLGTWILPGCRPGIRASVGGAIMAITAMLAHSGAGLPLGAVVWSLVALGAAGLTRRRVEAADLGHPLLVLALAFLVVGLVGGGLTYVPWGDDEFINWLRAAKQLFLARLEVSPKIAFALPSYPQAWPTFLALPSIVAGSFSEDAAGAVPFALHVVFLGLIYDFARFLTDRWRAWIFILVWLAAEVTWKLFPLSLMSEQPQIYSVTTVFILLLWAELDGAGNRRLMLGGAGLITAYAYLVKAAGIVLAPALAVAALWPLLVDWRNCRRLLRPAAVDLAVLLGPLVMVYLTWTRLAPGAMCTTNLGSYLSASGLADLLSDKSGDLAAYLRAVGSYYGSYKLPLTLGAAVGLTLGLVEQRTRKVTLAALAYMVIYHAALFWSYQTCPGDFNYYLSSLQRYILVSLRVLQALGVLLLFRFAVARLPLPGRGQVAVLAVTIGLLAGWQVLQTSRGLVEVRARTNGAEFAAIGRTIEGSAPALLRAVAAVGGKPDVLQLAEFTYAYPLFPTFHYLMNADGKTLPFRYCLALDRGNSVAMMSYSNDCGHDAFEQALAAAAILWPLSLSPFMAEKVRPLLDGDCPADLTGRVLIKRNGRFSCAEP